MSRRRKLLMAVVSLAWAGVCSAHVPYIERKDYTWDKPFYDQDLAQSIAVYSWLQSATDLDVYAFDIAAPERLLIDTLVPALPVYRNFFPKFAIIGPGLPQPEGSIPFSLPEGYGAVVVDYDSRAQPRPAMYEPFGGKRYFEGPVFDGTLSTPGRWAVVVWDDEGRRGDYVIAIGYQEQFSQADLVRALVNTSIIRKNGELHAPQWPTSGRSGMLKRGLTGF